MGEAINFTVNGIAYQVKSTDVSIDTTLNTYIRDVIELRGTKFMCLEGGCGACNVTVRGLHPVTLEQKTWVANSCLLPVLSCHGLDIVTVEGIGNKNGYDKTQTRIVLMNGVQCGYCTPGMVMNMHSLLESKNGKVTMEEVENSFGGNICRCTGYRPILDAFKSLANDATDPTPDLCKDIEDLKLCPKTGTKCAGRCKVVDKSQPITLKFDGDDEWHKVFSLSNLLQILKGIGNKTYMLVAGNTGHGVYRRDPKISVYIDVSSVAELKSHTSSGTEITLGGNVTLTETIDIFKKAASDPGFEYLEEVIKHIKLIANIPVRNFGTIAGNLKMKHEHNEFPSDVYLILDIIGANVTVSDVDGKQTNYNLVDFMNVDLEHCVIVKIIIYPIDPKKCVFRSYKIMPRAQNAQSHVNAAFLLEFNESKTSVVSAKLGFGGINPHFTHAIATEAMLIGSDLYTTDTVKAAMTSLNNEVEPDWVLPDASPEYRKKLALSLFYKFVINTSPEGRTRPQFLSGGNILDRGLSSGTQSFKTQPERYPLSLPLHRVDGFVQAGGETPFTNDLPKQPRELWIAVVHATKVHATITGFNTESALKVPGVIAFFSAKDIPGTNSFIALKLKFDPEELFCSGKVIWNGQPAGIIVAQSATIANYAATLVEIQYVGEVNVPVLPTMNDVIKANATDRMHKRDFDMNATEYGTDMVHKISGRFEVGSQFHFSLEPQTCVVIPAEDGLNVIVSTQWMTHVQVSISQVLNLPENRINIECRRLGGGFGGKQSRSCFSACAAALAAYLLQVPVRFVMTIESNMKVLGKRFSCLSNYEVDVDRNGKIQKLFQKYYTDHGHSFNDVVEFLVTGFFINCYDNKSWDIRSNAMLTDSPSNTYVRGPGVCEGIAQIENIMDHIAYKTGQDPIDVRLQNIPEGHPIKPKIPEFISKVDYQERRNEIEVYNRGSRWIKRGIAIMPIQYPQNYFGHFPAIVSINHVDGTISISHGGIEMGQGVTTKVCQVAAHTLGVPVEFIAIKPVTNLISPNTAVSGGSIVSDSACIAVLRACQKLNERLKLVKDDLGPNATWTDVTYECNNRNISLTEYYLQTQKEMINFNVYCLACCEVEIDILTGNFILRRVDILEDVGESISPLMDVGQVEGAFIMGLGFWLTEKLIYGHDGALLSNRTWNYHPPGPKDIPVDFRIEFIKDSPNPDFVLRSKVTGEPPICLSFVAVLALRNALMSARKDAGISETWFDCEAPYTVENIFLTAGHDHREYEL